MVQMVSMGRMLEEVCFPDYALLAVNMNVAKGALML
jgi:hypothetical protein